MLKISKLPTLPPLLLIGSLYVAQGLPFGFYAQWLPVELRAAGVSKAVIGLSGILALPWALKAAWAPHLDHGDRRGWILPLQALAIAVCLALALFTPSLAVVCALMLALNFLAATQDIATDGLAVQTLAQGERGYANALQVGAYRLGMIIGGAGVIWLQARHGNAVGFAALALALAVSTLPVWFYREPASVYAPRRRLLLITALVWVAAAGAMSVLDMTSWPLRFYGLAAVLAVLALVWITTAPQRQHSSTLKPLLERLRRPGFIGLLLACFAYKFGNGMASQMLAPMLVDLKLPKADIAEIKALAGSIMGLLGAVTGGFLMQKLNRRTGLMLGALAQTLGILAYVWLLNASTGDLYTTALTAVMVEHFLGAIATVALFTWMMDVADPNHAGTDYTLLASAVVLSGGLAGVLAGALADGLGDTVMLMLATALSALGGWAVLRKV